MVAATARLRIEQRPASEQQIKSILAVDPVRIELNVAGVVAGDGQAEEEQAARLEHAVDLLHGLEVAVGRERVAVPTQARVLDRRVASGRVEQLEHLAARLNHPVQVVVDVHPLQQLTVLVPSTSVNFMF